MEGFGMSLTSPPGQGKRLTQLLAYVVDDDDRTRRANLLLRNLSACLLATGIIVAAVMLTADGAGRYMALASGLVTLLLRRARTWWQRRSR
jgi:hypothetical protein